MAEMGQEQDSLREAEKMLAAARLHSAKHPPLSEDKAMDLATAEVRQYGAEARREATVDPAAKVAELLEFARFSGPTGDIEQILEEIERGRSGS